MTLGFPGLARLDKAGTVLHTAEAVGVFGVHGEPGDRGGCRSLVKGNQMRMGFVFVALAAMATLVVGCTSPPTVGHYAYKGVVEKSPHKILGIQTAYGESPTDGVVTDREVVLLYVEEASIDPLFTKSSTVRVVFDESDLKRSLRIAAKDRATRYGRFDITDDRSRADFVLHVTVLSMGSRADVQKNLDRYRVPGQSYINVEQMEKNLRDVILVSARLRLFDPRSQTQIASSAGTGVRVAEFSQLFQQVDARGVEGQRAVEVDTRRSDVELPKIMEMALHGAFLDIFPGIDHRLWQPPDKPGGFRIANRTSHRPQHVTTAPEPIPSSDK